MEGSERILSELMIVWVYIHLYRHANEMGRLFQFSNIWLVCKFSIYLYLWVCIDHEAI